MRNSWGDLERSSRPMDSPEQDHVYEFGGFRLDSVHRQLFAPDGRPVNLTSRVFDTLVCFVEHRGELLSKTDLMKAVWPDTVVEENNLNQAISTLRKALGEKKGEHRFIVTDPGRGYRFIADVKTVRLEAPLQSFPTEPKTGSPAADARQVRMVVPVMILVVLILIGGYIYIRHQNAEPEPTQAPEEERFVTVSAVHSIAILPFVNISPDPEQEYFADGIAEELLNQLSKLPGLQVAGRTSSFSFKGKNEDLRIIGDKLGVDHILEGSVRKSGNQVRITVQLVKASDGFHLWSESYDGDLSDIFAIQEETAKAVADTLSITLGVGVLYTGGTRNLEAYNAYLAGLSLARQGGREGLSRAIEQLEKAVALDPDFALAWSELSAICLNAATSFFAGDPGDLWAKFEAAADRAMAIAPHAAASLQALGVQQLLRREWIAAEHTLKEASRLAPGDYWTNFNYGHFLMTVGRPSEAAVYYRRAVRSEPLIILPRTILAFAYEFMGDPDKATREYELARSLEGDPAFIDVGQLVQALARNDRVQIMTHLEKVVLSDPMPRKNWALTRTMRELLDSPEKARLALHRFYTDPDYHNRLARGAIAVWSAYFGDYDLALRVFQGLEETGRFPSTYFAWRPIYKEMRRLPGFKELARSRGLVDYWRETGNWSEFCSPVGHNDFECR